MIGGSLGKLLPIARMARSYRLLPKIGGTPVGTRHTRERGLGIKLQDVSTLDLEPVPERSGFRL
jgi:hypothetical protein